MTAYYPWADRKALQKIAIVANTDRKWLVLERLGLAHLPEQIFALTHLTELVVIDNVLTRIPAEIAKLHNLTHLDLFYNKLEELPAEIGQLRELTHLDLSYNNLEILPRQIAELTNLKYLDLRGNNLAVPAEILENVNNPALILEFYLTQAETVPMLIDN